MAKRSKETLGYRPSYFERVWERLSKPSPDYDRGFMKHRISKKDRDLLVERVMKEHRVTRQEAFNRVRQIFTTGPYSGVVDWDKKNPRRESRARFIHEPLQSKRKFDPRSFRTKVSRAHRITFGCPKGQYSPSTELCKVPVQIQKILHPMEEAMLSNPCPLGKNSFPTGPRKRESWKTGRTLVSRKKFSELVKGVQDKYNVSEKEAKGWVRERYTTSLREKIFEGWGDPRKISSSRKRELVERFKGAYPGIYAKFKGRTRLNPKRRPLIERASYYKWYIGFKRPRTARVFTSRTKPTLKTHGYLFDFVTGPFESRKEASRFKVHSAV